MPHLPTLTNAELLRHVDAQHPCDPLVAELARRFGDVAGVTGDHLEMLEMLADLGIVDRDDLVAELARRFSDVAGVTGDQLEMLELLADLGIDHVNDLRKRLKRLKLT